MSAQATLEKVKAWLATYPHWDGTLQVDYSQGRPPNAGLLPKGLEEISVREDVLGNTQEECRYRFALSWQVAGQGDEGENAGKLLDFQHWVREQSARGLAPCFGDVPAREQMRTEKGGMTVGTQNVIYTVTLVADFMKVYEVNA